ncbi:unnamed protein product [Leuciscus chuanchicus]
MSRLSPLIPEAEEPGCGTGPWIVENDQLLRTETFVGISRRVSVFQQMQKRVKASGPERVQHDRSSGTNPPCMDYTINYYGQDVIMGNIAESHATRERNRNQNGSWGFKGIKYGLGEKQERQGIIPFTGERKRERGREREIDEMNNGELRSDWSPVVRLHRDWSRIRLSHLIRLVHSIAAGERVSGEKTPASATLILHQQEGERERP